MVAFLNLNHVYHSSKEQFDAAYHRVMASSRWILGDECSAFESEFAQFVGADHAIGVGNGLEALSLALRAAEIGHGDRVLVPAHTFIATWLAVADVGAIPVAVEPTQHPYLPRAQDYLAVLSDDIKAVIPVHLYGEFLNYRELRSVCDEKGVFLLEDAAQSHGAYCAGNNVGQIGHAAAFSFYPGKNLGAFGDAGAVVTSQPELALKIHKLRNYGSTERYVHEIPGRNSRLDELQAAFLRVRLQTLTQQNARRSQIAALYREGLKSLQNVTLPPACAEGSHAWHLFVIRTAEREKMRRFLEEAGVQTLIHYPIACYRAPPFAAYAPDGVTATDKLSSQVLSLPMGPHLSNADIDIVIDAVKRFCSP